jgi:preprotein translocase subunit SecF
MEFFKQQGTIDFMGKAKFSLLFSLVLVLGSLALLMVRGLNFGVDFAGGTIVQVQYDAPAPIAQIRQQLSANPLFADASVTEFGTPEEVIIRLGSSSQSIESDIGDETAKALEGSGAFEIRRVDMVGPKVGGELREKGLMALILATIGILIYVAFRFEWRFGVASIVALVHDIMIAIGALALFQIPVNLDVLAALLTILGYSLNDTIIVFDRIREGINTLKSTIFGEVINESVTRTLSRTTLTSLTTFFVVAMLYLFGGEIINAFAFTLLVGIVVGTYSSIFVASPTLMYFGFDIKAYRARMAEKTKRQAERERMRAQFEQGTL